ncbi:hypothetical protein [Mucilaginibacter corticis]|nr:hypothetical protein [Mucilaginibacter corticis]
MMVPNTHQEQVGVFRLLRTYLNDQKQHIVNWRAGTDRNRWPRRF